MLQYVLFDLSLFNEEKDRQNSQKRILALLQALTYSNQLYLRNNPGTPLIYESGIKYKVPQQFEKDDTSEVGILRQYLESQGAPQQVWQALYGINSKVGGEQFRDVARIIENGGGDCDNVASWRAAELRELGIRAQPYITWRRRPDGGMTYHVIVRWPDGSSEDPSLLLGMGGAAREKDRREEERKLAERMSDFIEGIKARKYVETVFGENDFDDDAYDPLDHVVDPFDGCP